jgi:hypothetical protein
MERSWCGSDESLSASPGAPEVREAPVTGREAPGEGRSDPGRWWTRRRGRLALLLTACTVALLCAEVAIRIGVGLMDRRPLLVRSEVTGWVLKPNLEGVRAYRGGEFSNTTDARGYRVTSPGPDRTNSVENEIILVGDSFVQGLGVADEDHLGWILAEAVERPVVNLGVLGFDTGQELLAVEHYFTTRADRSVSGGGDVVVLVFENDFAEILLDFAPFLGRSKPSFRLEAGVLEAVPYHPGFHDYLMDSSRLYWLVSSKWANVFPPSRGSGGLQEGQALDRERAGVDLVLASLARIRNVAEANGATFHVLAHRYVRGGALGDDMWTYFLSESDAWDVTSALLSGGGERLVGFDGLHWNRNGHLLVASLMQQSIEGTTDLSENQEGRG